MADIVVMPKLGLTMEEGYLERWLCEPGTAVELGQPICEVETEKLSVAVESPYAGVLLRHVEAESTIPVGEPIAIIGQPGEDPARYRLYDPSGGETPHPAAAAQPPATPAEPAHPTVPTPDSAASPLARRVAADLGVDLANVTGTGPQGRITRGDVERAAASQGLAVPPNVSTEQK